MTDQTRRDEVAEVLYRVWQTAELPAHFDQDGADALMPLLAKIEAEARAEAWDEGYGDDATCRVPRENPYRAAVGGEVGK